MMEMERDDSDCREWCVAAGCGRVTAVCFAVSVAVVHKKRREQAEYSQLGMQCYLPPRSMFVPRRLAFGAHCPICHRTVCKTVKLGQFAEGTFNERASNKSCCLGWLICSFELYVRCEWIIAFALNKPKDCISFEGGSISTQQWWPGLARSTITERARP